MILIIEEQFIYLKTINNYSNFWLSEILVQMRIGKTVALEDFCLQKLFIYLNYSI